MDEYLFISMAKLGADRVKAERVMRAAAPVRRATVVPATVSVPVAPPTREMARLAAFSLAFTLGLAAIGIGGTIAAVLESPAGHVEVTQVESSVAAPAELKAATNEAAR